MLGKQFFPIWFWSLFPGASWYPWGRVPCKSSKACFRKHLSNEKTLVGSGILGDEILPSYVGIISRSHYNSSLWNNQDDSWKVGLFFFFRGSPDIQSRFPLNAFPDAAWDGNSCQAVSLWMWLHFSLNASIIIHTWSICCFNVSWCTRMRNHYTSPRYDVMISLVLPSRNLLHLTFCHTAKLRVVLLKCLWSHVLML